MRLDTLLDQGVEEGILPEGAAHDRLRAGEEGVRQGAWIRRRLVERPRCGARVQRAQAPGQGRVARDVVGEAFQPEPEPRLAYPASVNADSGLEPVNCIEEEGVRLPV